MKIYIAGPLFSIAERDFNVKLVEELKRRDTNGILSFMLPQDFCAGEVKSTTIFDKCYMHLSKADLVVAILDGADADSGTCWEVGCAWAMNKPIIGVRTDFRGSGDTGGFNAMLKHSCRRIVQLETQDNNLALQFVADDLAYEISKLELV